MFAKISSFFHKRIVIIMLFILLIGLIILTGTYAWFTWSSTDNTNLKMSIGEIADVIFKGGPEINTDQLTPVFNYTDGEKISFSIENKSSSTIYHSVDFHLASLPGELQAFSFKYILLKIENNSSTEVASGDFSGSANNDILNLIIDAPLSPGTTSYDFYLYIDANLESELEMINKTFSGTLTVSARDI